MGSFCSSDTSTTTTSSTQPNKAGKKAYKNVIDTATHAASQPFTPYTGELTAPINPQQQTGIDNVNANSNVWQPYFNQASDYGNKGAQGVGRVTADQIQEYMDPFTQNVIDATQRQFANSNLEQQQGIIGNASTQGALGGNRISVAQAETARQQKLAQDPVIAQLYSQSYQQALAEANAQQANEQTNRGNERSAGSLFGNMGSAAQTSALEGPKAQISAGSLQQQTQQAEDTAKQNEFMRQQNDAMQKAQFLAQTTIPAAAGLGTTSSGSSTGAGASPLSTAVGLGTTAVGGLGAAGAFGPSGATDSNPSTWATQTSNANGTQIGSSGGGGWLSNWLANGGRVGFADGGDTSGMQAPTNPSYVNGVYRENPKQQYYTEKDYPKASREAVGKSLPALRGILGGFADGGMSDSDWYTADQYLPDAPKPLDTSTPLVSSMPAQQPQAMTQSGGSSGGGLGDVIKLAATVLPMFLKNGGQADRRTDKLHGHILNHLASGGAASPWSFNAGALSGLAGLIPGMASGAGGSGSGGIAGIASMLGMPDKREGAVMGSLGGLLPMLTGWPKFGDGGPVATILPAEGPRSTEGPAARIAGVITPEIVRQGLSPSMIKYLAAAAYQHNKKGYAEGGDIDPNDEYPPVPGAMMPIQPDPRGSIFGPGGGQPSATRSIQPMSLGTDPSDEDMPMADDPNTDYTDVSSDDTGDDGSDDSGLGSLSFPVAQNQTSSNPWLPVLAAGLGMMSGNSRNTAANIGAGGLKGLEMWQKQKALDQNTSNKNVATQLAVMKMLQDAKFKQAAVDKEPNLITELRAAGLKEGSPEWNAAILQATTKPNTTINNQGEGAFATNVGKADAERLDALEKAQALSKSKIKGLDQMEALVNDPNVYQGPLGEYVEQLKRIGTSLGVDPSLIAGVDSSTALSALTKQFALKLRNPSGGEGMPGSLSDADRDFLISATPSLNKTPGGNRQLIDMQRRLEKRNMEENEEESNYIYEHKSRAGLQKHMAEWGVNQPNLFADLRSKAKLSLKPLTPDVKAEAQKAIDGGKPREAIMKRLEENGFDSTGL